MPPPIAVGGRSVSAETSAPANRREEDSDDGIPLMPVELYQTIGWGVCPHSEWQVRVTAGYYDLMDFNKGARDCTMCELRVQVSLLAEPLSKQYRETIHHPMTKQIILILGGVSNKQCEQLVAVAAHKKIMLVPV